MADQQSGDKPAAGARDEKPVPRAPDKTRIDGGASTVDAPARWRAAAAVPPPVPKNSRWLRRLDRFIRPEPAPIDATAVDPDDWSKIPAVDPWAGQDTPLDVFSLPPDPPLPPTRVDAPAPPVFSPPPAAAAPKPPPPSAAPKPAAGSAAAPPPAAGQRAGATPQPAAPSRPMGWLLGWILAEREKQPPPPLISRLPVQPRPAPPPPAQPSVKRPPGRPSGRPAVGPVAPAANGRTVAPQRPQPGRPWTPPLAPSPPRKRRRGRRLVLFGLIGLVLLVGLPLVYDRYPAARQFPVTAALPESFSDLSLRHDDASRVAADRLARQLPAADTGSVFTGVYGDSHGKRVTIFGVTGWRLNPGGDVQAQLDRVSSEFGLGDIQSYDVGEAGVHESCGVGRSGGAAVVVCAWADHGSLATVLLTRRSRSDSADLVARLHGAVLTPAA